MENPIIRGWCSDKEQAYDDLETFRNLKSIYAALNENFCHIQNHLALEYLGKSLINLKHAMAVLHSDLKNIFGSIKDLQWP